MNELKLFDNPKFGQVRTVDLDGKIYFVASDVARSLGYAKPQNAISAHCKGALKWGIPTNGGNQEMNIIPEGDIYRLAAKSELPAADEFESWIFDEVLPSIRKNGFYGRPLTRKEEVRLYLEALEEQDAKIDAVYKDHQDLKNDLPLLGVECDRIVTAVKREGLIAFFSVKSKNVNALKKLFFKQLCPNYVQNSKFKMPFGKSKTLQSLKLQGFFWHSRDDSNIRRTV